MNTNTKLVAAKYRAHINNDGWGVYMFCFDYDTNSFEKSGSCVSRFKMTAEKAAASAAAFQAKEDKSVAKENKRLGFN